MISIVCDIFNFPGSHTAQRIKDCLEFIKLEWSNEENPVLSITSDNASNMVCYNFSFI